MNEWTTQEEHTCNASSQMEA